MTSYFKSFFSILSLDEWSNLRSDVQKLMEWFVKLLKDQVFVEGLKHLWEWVTERIGEVEWDAVLEFLANLPL